MTMPTTPLSTRADIAASLRLGAAATTPQIWAFAVFRIHGEDHVV
jgi:hypothetical protein